MRKYIVFYNPDGEESEATIKSAFDVSEVLGADKIILNSTKWKRQILDYLESGRILKEYTCFLATHGGFGESGELTRFITSLNMKCTHSPAEASATMSNKHQMKKAYQLLGINTPNWFYKKKFFPTNERPIAKRWLCKPIAGGSKNGISFVNDIGGSGDLIYEEYIEGVREISVWTLGKEKVIALPPLMRRRNPNELGVLRNNNKNPPKELSEYCKEKAKYIHYFLSAKGVVKTDFLIDPSKNIYAIETDAQPALDLESGVVRQAALLNISYKRLINIIGEQV